MKDKELDFRFDNINDMIMGFSVGIVTTYHLNYSIKEMLYFSAIGSVFLPFVMILYRFLMGKYNG